MRSDSNNETAGRAWRCTNEATQRSEILHNEPKFSVIDENAKLMPTFDIVTALRCLLAAAVQNETCMSAAGPALIPEDENAPR